MSGRISRSATPILLAALLACAARPPETWKPLAVPSSAYGASASCTFTLGGRTFQASGGCAVDPARGARVELRDAFGATRLLILVTPARATLLCPQSRLSYTWTQAGRDMPWSPSDLMAIFTGPPSASDRKSSAGSVWTCRWDNGVGRVTGRFKPGDAGAFAEASLQGPGRASLSLRLSAVRADTFDPDVFSVPAGFPAESAAPSRILQEASP